MGMFGRYTPDRRGLAALQQDPKLQSACLAVARQGAEMANQIDPEGGYEARSRVVTAGWKNSRRAGAAITQTSSSWSAARDEVLVQVARAMNSR